MASALRRSTDSPARCSSAILMASVASGSMSVPLLIRRLAERRDRFPVFYDAGFIVDVKIKVIFAVAKTADLRNVAMVFFDYASVLVNKRAVAHVRYFAANYHCLDCHAVFALLLAA